MITSVEVFQDEGRATAKTVHQTPLHLLHTYHSCILVPTLQSQEGGETYPGPYGLWKAERGDPPQAVCPVSLCGLSAMKPHHQSGQVLDACEHRGGKLNPPSEKKAAEKRMWKHDPDGHEGTKLTKVSAFLLCFFWPQSCPLPVCTSTQSQETEGEAPSQIHRACSLFRFLFGETSLLDFPQIPHFISSFLRPVLTTCH